MEGHIRLKVTNRSTKTRSPITQGASSLLSEVATRDIGRLYRHYYNIDVSRYFSGIEWLEYRECQQSGVRFFFPVCPGDGEFYAELSKNTWYYSKEKEEYRYASTWLKNAVSILDVGCGVGTFAEFVPHARFIGLEFSTEAQRAGRDAGRTILSIPVTDHAREVPNAYDAVTAFQVLEHVDEPFEFLLGLVACTRPGGLVVISVPAEDGAFGGCVNYTLNLPPHHMTHWTDRALTFVMSMVGLVDVTLYHLPLDAEHEVEAVTQFFARAVRGPRFYEKLIRIRLADRLFLAVLRQVAKRARRGITAPFLRGHTVVAVGHKPG